MEIHGIRWLTLFLLVLTSLLGLAFKGYRGPFQNLVNNYGPASICYVVFFVLLCFLLFPRPAAILPIVLGVCAWTCLVEFSQLWHPFGLDALRGSFAGRMLLGNSFSWWDFPAYAIGGCAGWLLCRWLAGSSQAARRAS